MPRALYKNWAVRIRRAQISGLIVLVFIFVFGLPLTMRSAGYTLPGSVAPIGSTPSLNISSTQQTKLGGLTLSGGLTAISPIGLTVYGRVCWNGDCLDEWPTTTAPGETLLETAKLPLGSVQTGWISLLGNNGDYLAADGQPRPFGLDVTSSAPTIATPTYAVIGYAGSTSVSGSSYGVFAAAGADTTNNYALYAKADAPTSWGGYFAGNVNILPPFDLIVGSGTLTQGPIPTTGEICLNGMCQSSWQISADKYWTETSNTIEALNATWGLAAGGKYTTTDSFYVQVFPASSTNAATAAVTNNGTANSSDLTVQ